MARSLSFVYLFVILAISYIGGALLFREWPAAAMDTIVGLYDQRVVKGREAVVWSPFLTSFVFIAVVLFLSRYKKLRFIIMLFGAVKCVLFGLSSTYLLSGGMKLIMYAVWWFPFQLAGSFLFLILCTVLHPPFFTAPAVRKDRPLSAVPLLIGMLFIIQLLELSIFHFLK
ncbi:MULTISPECIES: hypothetical protein [Sporosarcina]|uniref:hypothetical protein n=1 Tax=Sporosarcina TaxID=1569 RepID=UPI00129ACAF6|nr:MULTISPECIES: hypothetical protein [Sporosarcina]GKV65631.1 hypothetical protein NCCP2331_17840 [Sporosarcina sp. NCCP-2331]GLB55789.1 hypothetical protein NCCP2378_15760 [Sporosarcina sp. NCCP-2378]